MTRRLLRLSGPVLLLAVTLWADNPRSHLMIDPVNPRLSPSGFLAAAGPAWSWVLRSGLQYGIDGSRSPYAGLTSRLAGAGAELSFDNADFRGRWHLLPAFSMAFYPGQKAYADDVEKTLSACDYAHFTTGFCVGISDLPGAGRTRRYAVAGPALNMLVYRRETAVSRAAWGFCGRVGVVRPLKCGFRLLAEVNYRYAYFNRFYYGYDLDMTEHTHALGLSLGSAI